MSEEKANLTESTGDTAISGVKADGRRRAALGLVQMLYRLAKACLLHSDSNQAVLSLVPSAIDSIVQFCELSGTEAATLVFAGNTLFINGQMLRASRETYEVALELGSFFETCDVSEVVLDKAVRRAELAAFARLLADAQRDRSSAARLAQSSLRGVRVRKLTNPFPGGSIEGDGTRTGRISRTYAAALLVMRGFYAGLRAGEAALPQRVKRVAQKLVAAAEEDARLLLSIAAGKVADPDEAGLSVSTAIVALGIARQLTTDRRMLGGLVTAALLYDVSRLRLTGAVAGAATGGGEPAAGPFLERSLSEDEKERLPASAAVMLTALGKLHAPSITRTVIAYEALALRPGGPRGPLYGGRRSPTVLARILAVARQFTELRSASFPVLDGAPGGASLDGVLQRMTTGAESATDRAIGRLLVGALGIIPTGTFVQLSTGELGVVLATPASPAHFAQPPVRLLFDEQGQRLAAPVDVDLSLRAPGAEPCFIVRPAQVEPHHERAIRAAFGFGAARSSAGVDARAAAAGVDARAAAGVEARVTAAPPFLSEDEVPATEPGNTLASRALRPAEESARSSPSRKDAAWLGKPLVGVARAAPSSHGAQPRPPVSAERPARAERGRDENLISTQPPPSAAAAHAPAVPPPPRLPRDSRPFGALASSRYPAPPPSRRAERRGDASAPDQGVGQLPTIGPPSGPAVSRRAGDYRLGPPSRRLDSRAEPEESDWNDELPTIDPPPPHSPPTSRSPSYVPEPVPTERNALQALAGLSHGPGLEEADLTWTDELPTLDPPPPSTETEERERDRLLAAYLAEQTPLPLAAHREWSTTPGATPYVAETEHGTWRGGAPPSPSGGPESRRGAPPSQRGAQESRDGAPPSQRGAQESRGGAAESQRGGPASRRGAPPSQRGAPASRRGAPPSQRGAPASRRGAPESRAAPPISSGSYGGSRRPPRAPIPREEPEDDGYTPPAPEGRDR
ncbi:uncharacterized protein SOCEGT47_069710 [Sorangium cellulosum]|uniref:HD-GYP domain-containing protein n=1 Tax=Sorangium cellulosum TaxID=56 RepID=A0A4P2Q9X4_SORCE|nr:hypothetical protein [Sorangium cellulosum]AUX26410.1 uncharacterized protein SOCEGT47_069710 [Sorangium cellulosum]